MNELLVTRWALRAALAGTLTAGCGGSVGEDVRAAARAAKAAAGARVPRAALSKWLAEQSRGETCGY